MYLTVSSNAGFREQAEYKAKAEGEGANEKSILDALKQSYAAKVKELEEAEVRCIITPLHAHASSNKRKPASSPRPPLDV